MDQNVQNNTVNNSGQAGQNNPKVVSSDTPTTPVLNVNIVGRRITAGILEIIFWSILFFIAAQLFGAHDVLKTVSTTTNLAGQTVDQGQKVTYQSNLTGIPFLIFSLIAFMYFVLLEWLVGGTISKLILGLKVVSIEGNKISLKQSFTRNVLRLIDDFPYIIPYLVGLIILSTNSNKQRLGDKLAHTVVVRK